MAVRVVTGGDLAPDAPRALFVGDYQDVGAVIDDDVTAGGRRFLKIRPADPQPAFTRVQIVLNWFTELRRTGSAGR